MRIWQFILDMNGDGATTISDVWLWLKWLYFYPGDGFFFLAMKHLESLSSFFEISPSSYGGAASAFISFFVWAAVLSCWSSAEEINWTKPKKPIDSHENG